MNWIPLTSIKGLETVIERSKEVPCAIFKHSTRCGISSMAKFRLEGDWDFAADQLEPYYLDILSFRNISKAVAEQFSVHHESPQILLIRQGECTYDASHLDITVAELKECYIDVFP